MTRSERRGAAGGASWPRRPLLTALWIPAAAVLLPLGGMLGAFGPWLLLPSLALVVTGAVGLVVALWSLCPSRALQWVAMSLVFAPLIGVPLLSMSTARATVLSVRGTTHSGTVTEVRVDHGRSTSYHCTVRYRDAPDRSRSVDCAASDTVGEQVSVTEDPDGLVDPEFTAAAGKGRLDLDLTAFFDIGLLATASAAAAVGFLIHLTRTRPRSRIGNTTTGTQ